MASLPQPGGMQRSEQKFIVFENFEKMNTQALRQGLKENELAWLENLQPIAPNKLLTVPAPAAAALATIGETIAVMFYADIGGTDYFIVFTTAGSAYALNIALGNIFKFAPDGTFSTSPDVTTWQASRILIADSIGGYSTYDGTLYVTQGGVSPNITVTDGGSGYGTPPPVTISGGSGSGAAGVAVVSAGAIVAVNLTNSGTGYQAADTLAVSFGTSPGSGATATAALAPSPLASISIASPGAFTDYTGAPEQDAPVVFSGGGGTGAAATAFIKYYAGPKYFQCTGVILTNPGINYTSTPNAVIAGIPGTSIGPGFSISLQAASVGSVTLTADGSGYSANPNVSIVSRNGFGSGASAVATEVGGAVNSLTLTPSAVTSVQIITAGAYTQNGIYPLIFTGGGGSSAAGTATIAGGVVTSVSLTSGGANYTTPPTVTVNATNTSQATFFVLIASQGSGYTLPPIVTIGSGSGATAIAHVWPYIPAPTTLAIFQGRVWLGGGQLLQWTGTGASYGNIGYDDFLSADASDSTLITDADLVHSIQALRSFNNYLWIVGDQSVKQIGNISITGGDVTSFTILTISSDQGTIYKYSCVSFNRVFLFLNSKGIYGVFGSSVQKLSDDLDGIFKLIDFTQQPQGALADINAIHNAVFLVRYVDPVLGERSILLTFNGKKWFVTAQGNSLAAIATAQTLSTDADSLYGSSGNDITGLFSSATTPVAFKVQTSLTHHGNAVQRKKVLRAGFSASLASGSGKVLMTVEASGKQLKPGANPEIQSAQRALVAGFQLVGFGDEEVNTSGVYLGMTLTGTLAGLTVTNMAIEMQETSLWK